MALDLTCRLLTPRSSPTQSMLHSPQAMYSQSPVWTFPSKRLTCTSLCCSSPATSPHRPCFHVTTLCHSPSSNPSSDLVDSGGNHEVVVEQLSFLHLFVPSMYSQQAVYLLPEVILGISFPCHPGALFLVIQSISVAPLWELPECLPSRNHTALDYSTVQESSLTHWQFRGKGYLFIS